MSRSFIFLLFTTVFFVLNAQNGEYIVPRLEGRENNGTVIAFGSCNKVDLPQPLWPEISLTQPDVFIWLGDNIYADTKNMKAMEKMYDEQKANPAYSAFCSKVKVIGTWDDHDYGENDGGKEFPKKAESRDLALDFLDVPKEAEVWQHEGMYQAYYLGDEKIKILLLDTRYFRDPIQKADGQYVPNREGDILGEEQWDWLSRELRDDEGQEITIIASSIQVIPSEQPYEKWANFPGARSRLFELLHAANAKNVIFLSGDRHMGELSVMEYKGKNYYEITSSGLTHVWEDMPEEKNRYRRGNVIHELNYGLIEIQPREGLKDLCVLQIRGAEKRQLLSLTIELQ